MKEIEQINQKLPNWFIGRFVLLKINLPPGQSFFLLRFKLGGGLPRLTDEQIQDSLNKSIDEELRDFFGVDNLDKVNVQVCDKGDLICEPNLIILNGGSALGSQELSDFVRHRKITMSLLKKHFKGREIKTKV
jgi:hypothetical protein